MKNFFFLFCTVMLLMSNSAYCMSETKESDENEVYFLWDFQDGKTATSIPEGFLLFDGDEMTYDSFAGYCGFDKERPWVWTLENAKSDNGCIACFPFYSRYTEDTKTKLSQDWIVTPGMYVSPKNGKITWRSKSDPLDSGATNGYRGAYNVYISTTGQNPEDFTEAPVFVMEGDSTDWHEYSIDVSKYHKQTIYVAFADQTADEKFFGVVLVDDIALVGEKRTVNIEPSNDRYVYGNQDVTMKCKYTIVNDTPVSELKLCYSYDGNTYIKEVDVTDLQKDKTVEATFDDKVAMSVSDTVHYEMWAVINGVDYPTIDGELVCLSFKPNRKVVVEEGTGMWCAYCPAGIIALHQMYEKHPDNFIGIAVHNQDILNCDEEYTSKFGWKTYPIATVNRKYTSKNLMVLQKDGDKEFLSTLNGGIETYILKELDEDVAAASVTLTAGYKDKEQKNIDAKVNYKFAKNYSGADLRIAFVLVENNVTGKEFYQKNNYSTWKGDAYGWEKLPATIDNMVFQDVARGIYEFNGIEGSIPSEITAGTEMSYDYSIEVPVTKYAPQIVANNLYVVAMIIDTKTGHVINADKVYLGDPTNICSDNKVNNVRYALSGGICTVTLSEEYTGNAKIELVDLNGRVLVSSKVDCGNNKEVSIPVSSSKGVCLLRVVTEDKTTVSKLMVD